MNIQAAIQKIVVKHITTNHRWELLEELDCDSATQCGPKGARNRTQFCRRWKRIPELWLSTTIVSFSGSPECTSLSVVSSSHHCPYSEIWGPHACPWRTTQLRRCCLPQGVKQRNPRLQNNTSICLVVDSCPNNHSSSLRHFRILLFEASCSFIPSDCLVVDSCRNQHVTFQFIVPNDLKRSTIEKKPERSSFSIIVDRKSGYGICCWWCCCFHPWLRNTPYIVVSVVANLGFVLRQNFEGELKNSSTSNLMFWNGQDTSCNVSKSYIHPTLCPTNFNGSFHISESCLITHQGLYNNFLAPAFAHDRIICTTAWYLVD